MNNILTKLKLLEQEIDNYIKTDTDEIALASIKNEIAQIRQELELLKEESDHERSLELLIKLIELLNSLWLSNM